MRDGWKDTTLSEVLTISRERIDPSQLEPDYELIHWSIPQLDETGRPSTETASEIGSHKFAVQKDSVVYSLLNPRIPRFAKIAGGSRVVCSTEFAVLQPDSSLSLDFLYCFVTSPNFQEQVRSLAKGTTKSRERIDNKEINKINIKLPPLPEQKRIVDLISSVDSYIEALQQHLECAKRFRNAKLHKAFHIDNPNWKFQKLEDCTQRISDGSHNPPKGIAESEFLMLSSKDVWDGYLTNLDPRFLKQNDFELENKRTQLESGDVLLTVVGTIGRCAVYKGYPNNVTFQRSVCVIKTSKDILNETFLMMYLQSIQPYLDQNARGVAQRGIYLNQIRNLEVPIPSLQEQLEVVSNIEVIDIFIQETQKIIAQSKKLRAAILSDLLSGEHEIPTSYDKVIGAA